MNRIGIWKESKGRSEYEMKEGRMRRGGLVDIGSFSVFVVAGR